MARPWARCGGAASGLVAMWAGAAAAGTTAAITGHAFLSGAADHSGIAVTLSQMHVGFSGAALAAMLVALAAVVLVTWRRGAGQRARLVAAGVVGIAIAGGGRFLGRRCPRRAAGDGDRPERPLVLWAWRGRNGVCTGQLRAALSL
ncbi:MAG: hypothetical protein HYV63_29575 [Candidatus Schekmanbacteria bacterium]|nr:hypothetical protein [Candidatus Schekmanbacteria bacterium]